MQITTTLKVELFPTKNLFMQMVEKENSYYKLRI